jgi:mRNA interferase RelE/StbE
LDSDTPQTDNLEYQIQLTPLALEMLIGVKDRRQQKGLSDRIDKLKLDPEKQGKPLVDKLKGYRSVRAVSQRYRIIYRVDIDKVIVLVVGMGLRQEGDKGDVYALIERSLSIISNTRKEI